MTLSDVSASSAETGTGNSNGGDYGVLFQTAGGGTAQTGLGTGSIAKGVVFYQAGIVVLTASVFSNKDSDFFIESNGTKRGIGNAYVSASISGSCNAIRRRIRNISFNNNTEINSTIYFCRAPHNKFNYTSNPTYVSGSKIVVKNVAADEPKTYITTVGLYSSANELLAIAKLSEPLKKDPSNEITLRVRLDY